MKISEAIKNRKSTRSFLKKDVNFETVQKILDIARWSASGANTQPWDVAVVKGELKDKICNEYINAFKKGKPANMDYKYYPDKWFEPYKERRVKCGFQLYDALNIKRQDHEKRKEQWINNYNAFDAPVVLFFFIDPGLQTGSYMDYGMFLKCIMLAALEQGLGTCPQASLADYPEIVKKSLKITDEKILLCGMALGYENIDDPVNKYRTPREGVDNFTKFYE